MGSKQTAHKLRPPTSRDAETRWQLAGEMVDDIATNLGYQPPLEVRTKAVEEIYARLMRFPAEVENNMTFTDWAGQTIPYRIVPVETDSDDRFVCEIDPHSVNQWRGFGRGRTNEAALKSATEAWNALIAKPKGIHDLPIDPKGP